MICESRDERRPNPTKGKPDPPLTTDRERFRGGEGVIGGSQDGLERGIGLWEEWGVLRLGMVSEGGEYGSHPPSPFMIW